MTVPAECLVRWRLWSRWTPGHHYSIRHASSILHTCGKLEYEFPVISLDGCLLHPSPSFCQQGYELVTSLPALMCQGHLPGMPVSAVTPSSRPAHITSALKSDPIPSSQDEITPCSLEHILIPVCLSVWCNSLLIDLSAFLGVSKSRLLLIHTVSPAPCRLPGQCRGSVNTCVVPSETHDL